MWKPETFSTKCLTSKEIVFEPIEDNNIDSIEEIKVTGNIVDTRVLVINELVQAVKQLNREIKELKEK